MVAARVRTALITRCVKLFVFLQLYHLKKHSMQTIVEVACYGVCQLDGPRLPTLTGSRQG
jgi:hypothetical protein